MRVIHEALSRGLTQFAASLDDCRVPPALRTTGRFPSESRSWIRISRKQSGEVEVEHLLPGENFCQNTGGPHSQIAHQIHRNIPSPTLLEHPGQRRLSNFARAQHDNSALLRRKAPGTQFGSIGNETSYPEERGKAKALECSWSSVDVIVEMNLLWSHIADLFTCSVSPEGGNILWPSGCAAPLRSRHLFRHV